MPIQALGGARRWAWTLDSTRIIVITPARVEVSLATASERAVVASFLVAHLTELGASSDYPYFEHYWSDPERHPFLFCTNGNRAGFALVRRPRDSHDFEMAEFYVVPAFRRAGVGSSAAEALFSIFLGSWRIPVLSQNRVGLAFWSRVTSSPGPAAVEGDKVVFLYSTHREPAIGAV